MIIISGSKDTLAKKILESGWMIGKFYVSPTSDNYSRYEGIHSSIDKIDPVFTFRFAEQHMAEDLYIHESRLIAAGGPMAAMVQRDFWERRSRHVLLSPEDSPKTFAIVRAYLYCSRFEVGHQHDYAAAACTAHRWQLKNLFNVLCCYMSAFCILPNVSAVKCALKVACLPDLPSHFKHFFWNSVAKKYFKFEESSLFRPSNMQSFPEGKALLEERFRRPFIGAWGLATSHGMAAFLMNYLRKYVSFPHMDLYFLELILVYLEPHILDDEKLQQLINEQLIYTQNPTRVFSFEQSSVSANASRRALKHFSIATANGWHIVPISQIRGPAWTTVIWPPGNCSAVYGKDHDCCFVSHDDMFLIRLRHYIVKSVSALEMKILVSAQSKQVKKETDPHKFTPSMGEMMNLTLRFIVGECMCDDAPRAFSETCAVTISTVEAVTYIPFQSLSAELTKHSPNSRCTGKFSYTYSMIHSHGLFHFGKRSSGRSWYSM